ncbi:DMT family transporter [Paenibacillus planticolens]|uniref:EamA family transporter n=1 Tax=Paenibacillus planticolens TaxID=2654976 RepID=A0ABX1ZPA8_9BACL|nr:DMT family transporter [Paenibacillus planticolens]NOV01907.1 EamA family transporter [Paenibacillus planticolens]
MNGILFGLLSAFSFGTADFFAGKASKNTGVFSTLFYMQVVGFVFLTSAVTWYGQWHNLNSLSHVAAASLWMALDLIGILFLYQGLVSGKSSVVAPIASSFSVFTVILAFVFGERLSIVKLAAIVLTLVGIVLTTLVLSDRGKSRSGQKLESGAVWAIFAALFLGTAFFGLRYPHEALGGLVTVWIGRLQATILLPVVYACFKKRIVLPDKKNAGLIIIVGILDAIALVCYNLGLGLEDTSIVITATSLFAVVTLFWGVFLGGEKPSWNQWVGIGCTSIGIFLISLL